LEEFQKNQEKLKEYKLDKLNEKKILKNDNNKDNKRSKSQTPILSTKKLVKKEYKLNNNENNIKPNQIPDTKINVSNQENENLDKQLSEEEITKRIEDIENNNTDINIENFSNKNDQKEIQPLVEAKFEESIGSNVSKKSQLKGIETKERVKLLLMRSMSSD